MMKTISGLFTLLLFTALPVYSMVSVARVHSPDEMPAHLKFRISPGSNGLTNVWITIVEENPEKAGVWASLETRSEGQFHSRASLVSHPSEEEFSVSFQMKKAAFAESTIMIAVRGRDLSDIGYEVKLSIFEPDSDPPE